MKPIRTVVVALASLALSASAIGAAPSDTASPDAQVAEARNAEVMRACAAAPKDAGVCPLQATFGIMRMNSNNDVLDFKPSRVVPLIDDQAYGWVLRLNKRKGKVRVLERFTMPATPATWGTAGQHAGSSADSRSMSLDFELRIYDGIVNKGWSVAPGDPAGHHTIQVWVGDSAPLQFDFDVVRPDEKAQQ